MPEGMNVEIAEVAVLAIVAIATAWSGYQAARWDGQQSLLYGQATAARFRAAAASTHGGQGLSADASMFHRVLAGSLRWGHQARGELRASFHTGLRDRLRRTLRVSTISDRDRAALQRTPVRMATTAVALSLAAYTTFACLLAAASGNGAREAY